ncbi:hypothetical protein DDW13_00685 [Acidianus hospitalis]|jgi:hypothetical protein|uniref:VapB-type antitoxin n=1 Tax=Acidianus hospitalis TaxID=563177 RepID=A0A2T9XBU7_9CREN|nr:antitoxin VapB family protein [Acidianus sp.]PVU77482.1 hypothetical protein DDW13_00685 [Acidianus hospitalis]
MKEKELTTISISEKTKKKLEAIKGSMSWDEFLLNLAEDYQKRRIKEGIDKLREIISEEDIKKIEESHKKMHEEFKL